MLFLLICSKLMQMKITLTTFLLSAFFVLESSAFSSIASTALPVTKATVVEPVSKTEKKPSFKSTRQSAEKKLGRKLKLKETIGLWFYTKLPDYDKDYKRKANNQALTGFVLGLCSIVIFPVIAIPGFFISSAALSKEKIYPGVLEGGNKGLAKAGYILSIIGFILLLLYIAYILIIINSTSFFLF